MTTKLVVKVKAKKATNQPQQVLTPAKNKENSISNESMFATQAEVEKVMDKMHGFYENWDELMESLSEFDRAIAIEHKLIKWRYKETTNLEKLYAYTKSALKWVCPKRAPHAFAKFTNEIINELRKNGYEYCKK